MPVYSRRTLRQGLGQSYLHDTIVGQTSGSWGTQAGSANIIDSAQADPTASGEQMYFRHWLRLLGSGGKMQDFRVGTFNTGSGAYLAAITLATTVFSGMPFEVHALLDPADKDRQLDLVIQQIKDRQDVPIWAIDQGHVYSLGPEILDVLNVRYFSDPTDSLNPGEHPVSWSKFEKTATGQQLLIEPALVYSYQLILDAILTPTLGAGDLATVNLPSEDVVLWGAAARCWWLVEQSSPGQESGIYKQKRTEAAREYTRLAQRFAPKVTRKIQLDEWVQ